jgi:hypothetical protein
VRSKASYILVDATIDACVYPNVNVRTRTPARQQSALRCIHPKAVGDGGIWTCPHAGFLVGGGTRAHVPRTWQARLEERTHLRNQKTMGRAGAHAT